MASYTYTRRATGLLLLALDQPAVVPAHHWHVTEGQSEVPEGPDNEDHQQN